MNEMESRTKTDRHTSLVERAKQSVYERLPWVRRRWRREWERVAIESTAVWRWEFERLPKDVKEQLADPLYRLGAGWMDWTDREIAADDAIAVLRVSTERRVEEAFQWWLKTAHPQFRDPIYWEQ